MANSGWRIKIAIIIKLSTNLSLSISSTVPKSEDLPVILATLPSKISKYPDNKSKTTLTDISINIVTALRKPKNSDNKVKLFGDTLLVSLLATISTKYF